MINIPDKSTFKVEEVCELTGVKPYVLRFWESEFDQLDPIVSSSGQKLYEHEDIEVIALIKKLLFEDKHSVEKAKVELSKVLDQMKLSEIIDLPVESKLNEFGTNLSIDNNSFEESSIDQILSAKDMQKLVLAKAKLSSIIMQTSDIQKGHNW